MPGLVMTYFNRSEPFTVTEKKIQTTEGLLSFLLEVKQDSRMVLMHSPTHAFIYRPDFLPDDIPRALDEMKEFWKDMEIADEDWLAERFSLRLPEMQQSLFLHRWRQKRGPKGLAALRTLLLEIGSSGSAMVDSFLYESLPLIEAKQAALLASELVGPCTSFFTDQAYFTPTLFRERVKAIFLSKLNSPLSSEDLDETIAQFLRLKGLAAPKPILFADTNWSAGLFGLAISPSCSFELWRFHRTAMMGTPMPQWFDLQKDGSWVVLSRPEEYTRSS